MNSRKFLSAVLFFMLTICFSGCFLLKEKSGPNLQYITAVKQPIDPEKAQEIIGDVSKDWFYGPGVGSSMLKAGTAVVFPPYGIYVLGNFFLSLAGYETIGVSDVLSDEGRDDWVAIFDTLVSGPGRFTAAVAGEEFRTREMAKERMQEYLKELAPEAAELMK